MSVGLPSVPGMTSLRPRPDHQDTVSRRLALLTAEAADSRAEDDWTAGHTRVRPLRPVPDPPHGPPPPGPPSAPPPGVPLPGRHAARRVRAGPLPAALQGRVALGPAQLAVVAVLVAAALAVTGWWLVRGDPERLEAPAPQTSLATGSVSPLADATPAAGAPSATGAAGGSVTVDVAGKVRRPGIVVLDAGARVVDAIEAAGGARRGVDLSSLNLARVLVDGEQVLVGAPAASAPGPAPVGGSPAPGSLVNLNTATQAQLEELPEVGPVTAQAILAWRQEHGGFTAVDELLEVDGIGDATLAKLAPYVTV